MPIRFSTEAANADKIGVDNDAAGAPQGMPDAAEADARPRERDKPVAGKPGKDINAPGFLKEKETDPDRA